MLSNDTGALRGYGSDPCGSYTEPSGYYVEPGSYFPLRNSDTRLGDKEVVVGVRAGSDRLAIHKDPIRLDGSTDVEVGGVPWRALWDNELGTARVVHAVTGEPADFLDAMWFAWYAFYPDTRLLV